MKIQKRGKQNITSEKGSLDEKIMWNHKIIEEGLRKEN